MYRDDMEACIEVGKILGGSPAEGQCVFFVNGDMLDFDPENLLVIDQDEARKLEYVHYSYFKLTKRSITTLLTKWRYKANRGPKKAGRGYKRFRGASTYMANRGRRLKPKPKRKFDRKIIRKPVMPPIDLEMDGDTPPW